MNGVTEIEPDCSDFVEVDPTGRYGRVIFLVFLCWVSLFSHFQFTRCCLLNFILQYNEILGKGASKTVYETFLNKLLKFFNILCWNSIGLL